MSQRAHCGALLCPHGICLPILPLMAPFTQAALGLHVPARYRQRAGEPAWGQGVAAPRDPALMDLEFPRSGSHCEQEKHSQRRAMGKAPPPAVMLPAPAAASQASLASQATCMRRQLCPPEERCWATAGSPQQPDLWEGVHGVARVPGCVGRRCGLGSRIGCRGCFRVLGGSEGRDGMLGRGELFQLPASLMSIPSPLHGC